MKYCLLIIAILILPLAGGAQAQADKPYLWAEFDGIGRGCDENTRIWSYIEDLKKLPASKGLVVIYTGENSERYGNISAYLRGFKEWLSYFKGGDHVDVVLADGKTLFYEEYWIVPENTPPPAVPASTEPDLRKIGSKYLFSNACLQCDPSYPSLIGEQANFEDYIAVLKNNRELRGTITVYSASDARTVRRKLTAKGKLPRSRYTVSVLRPPDEFAIGVKLYLVPNN